MVGKEVRRGGGGEGRGRGYLGVSGSMLSRLKLHHLLQQRQHTSLVQCQGHRHGIQ